MVGGVFKMRSVERERDKTLLWKDGKMKGKKKDQKRGERTESRNSFQLDEREEVGEIKIREEERKKRREVRER